MAAKIYLPVVNDADPQQDSILHYDKLPAFRGHNPHENLACGACKEVVARNISTLEIDLAPTPGGRLLIGCPCGAVVQLKARGS